jgi:hypothetical protein
MHQMMRLLSDRFDVLHVSQVEPVKPSDQSQWFSSITAYREHHFRGAEAS